LLPPCIDQASGVWADLGCGEGIFTAILYEQIGPSSEIYAVDKDRRALNSLKYNFRSSYPEARIHLLHADFTEPLSLPLLDGFVLANTLHFVKDQQKARILGNLSTKLKPNGKIIVIEYNTNRGNFAVPFPLNQDQFIKLAKRLNLRKPQIVAKAPSSFLGEMYAGTAFAPRIHSDPKI
jgi:ubiquinone/menaquinone biosynthesis C-methylase UbiE